MSIELTPEQAKRVKATERAWLTLCQVAKPGGPGFWLRRRDMEDGEFEALMTLRDCGMITAEEQDVGLFFVKLIGLPPSNL